MGNSFLNWCQALEKKHLKQLAFAEVRRGLSALSNIYVGKRHKLKHGTALDGAGKRAAFAWFYTPLHFLTVQAIIRALNFTEQKCKQIIDLGCGTGAAGAALALEYHQQPLLLGIDNNHWACVEARQNWQYFGLTGEVHQGNLINATRGSKGVALIVAYAANELAANNREKLLKHLITAAQNGARLLIIEPIAHTSVPWWSDWAKIIVSHGGRNDEWSFPLELPERLRLLDKAAGLNHTRIKARSLALNAITNDDKPDDLA
ncbi:MAG: methyltransferase [Deltaproteobacteria bacterium]|nr:methyltransferase [Deltaproteobacteria bacterium]